MYRTVKPFIKWAGGKSQLLDKIREKYPERIEKYCEPFVGGGAVLLDILANFQVKDVLINDINPELINAYNQIRDNVDDIVGLLTETQEVYWSMGSEQRKAFFYTKRNRFNELIQESADTIEKAALFIFINKTCFNGLYRVNAKGLYNVPIGEYKKPPICDTENLRTISTMLKGVQIKCGNYSECKNFIDKNTFVYIDPPYRPLSDTSSFTSYAKTEFGDEEQIQLGRFINEMAEKGAKIVASNSDPKNTDVNDNFFDDIYKHFSISRIKATRMINSKSSGRGSVNELLICNF